MSALQRHVNRLGLGTPAGGAATAHVGTIVCGCPARTVAGTVWAYDRALAWHDPDEHTTWTPPRQPTRAPQPPALLALDAHLARSGRVTQGALDDWASAGTIVAS